MAYISFMLFFLSFLRTVQYLYAQGWQSHQRRKGNTACNIGMTQVVVVFSTYVFQYFSTLKDGWIESVFHMYDD